MRYGQKKRDARDARRRHPKTYTRANLRRNKGKNGVRAKTRKRRRQTYIWATAEQTQRCQSRFGVSIFVSKFFAHLPFPTPATWPSARRHLGLAGKRLAKSKDGRNTGNYINLKFPLKTERRPEQLSLRLSGSRRSCGKRSWAAAHVPPD